MCGQLLVSQMRLPNQKSNQFVLPNNATNPRNQLLIFEISTDNTLVSRQKFLSHEYWNN